jgi:hypothetical protein
LAELKRWIAAGSEKDSTSVSSSEKEKSRFNKIFERHKYLQQFECLFPGYSIILLYELVKIINIPG